MWAFQMLIASNRILIYFGCRILIQSRCKSWELLSTPPIQRFLVLRLEKSQRLPLIRHSSQSFLKSDLMIGSNMEMPLVPMRESGLCLRDQLTNGDMRQHLFIF